MKFCKVNHKIAKRTKNLYIAVKIKEIHLKQIESMRRAIILPITALSFIAVILICTLEAPKAPKKFNSTKFICEKVSLSNKGKLKWELKDINKIGIVLYSSNAITFENSTSILPGDTIIIKNIKLREIPTNIKTYKSYMARKGYFYQGFFNQKNITHIKTEKHKLSFKHKMARRQIKLNQYIIKILSPCDKNTYAIACSLGTGIKDNISKELKNSYSKSGSSHILALSGLHIGVIYGLLNIILSIFFISPKFKPIKSLIILLFLWFFALFVGIGDSIFRAVLMISIYEIATFIHREKYPLGALSISAIIILLLDNQAIHSLSFRLSFEAMLGIILIFPILKKESINAIKFLTNGYNSSEKYTFINLVNRLLEICYISISCQLFTAVEIYLTFGTYSPYFLLTNILIIPLAGTIMPLIPISIICSQIPYLGSLTAYILKFLISYLNYIVETISSLCAA